MQPNGRFYPFAGSDRGGQRAAVMYSLIVTAKMNDLDPQAWLADVLQLASPSTRHSTYRNNPKCAEFTVPRRAAASTERTNEQTATTQ